MTIRPDAYVVNRVSNVAPSWVQCTWGLCGRAAVMCLVSMTVETSSISRTLADDDDVDVAPAAVVAEQVVIFGDQVDLVAVGGGQIQGVIVMDGGRRIQIGQRLQMEDQTASEAEARKQWNSQLASQVQAMDRLYSLSEAQKKKLQLAGKGDIHRHFSRLSELRSKVTAVPLQREQFAARMKELQLIQNITREHIFGDDSLFQKTLRTMLTEEQRVRYRSVEREQQRRIIESVMLDWDRTDGRFKLWGEPRKKFIELMVTHAQVPASAGTYSHQIVFLEAWRLREQVKPLLTTNEWEKFEWQVGRAKQMIPTLEARGLWTARLSDDDDEASPEATKK